MRTGVAVLRNPVDSRKRCDENENTPFAMSGKYFSAAYDSLKIAAALSISSGQNTNRHLASGEDTEP